ncbi:MAG: GNAT family N-acetyltransferase [Fidelibacterota bacterium]
METTYSLKDKTIVTVRDLASEDVDASLRFFLSIPENERRYLRSDVTSRKHIEDRIQQALAGKIIRRVVELDGIIIADGSLEILTEEWKDGTGHIRLVIGKDYRNRGAGHILAWDLYHTAYNHKLKRIVTKLMRPQVNTISLFEELGFKVSGLIPDYLVDRMGKAQDMVILVCPLDMLRKAHAFVGDWVDSGNSSIGAGEI